ncbi:hypothetical protein ABMY26_00250 (plasmid) [Azospirillum sp. HJ39]|uniref:hypothetical protein n=1 Tax=Azospirillum sp. HJ39 TaxID=3159496 RepID=UPI0035577AB1
MRNAARLTMGLLVGAIALIAVAADAQQPLSPNPIPPNIDSFSTAAAALLQVLYSGGPVVMIVTVLSFFATTAWLIYSLRFLVKPVGSVILMFRQGTTEREQELEKKLTAAEKKLSTMEGLIGQMQHQLEEQDQILKALIPYVDPKKFDPAVLQNIFKRAALVPQGA